MRKKGFTMVELIAIVVIMASMLLVILPSINNTIKRSEEKDKEEALNSIYMAAENFLMDNYEDYKIDNTGDTTYIYITDLINNNYMSINALNPNNNSSFNKNDAVKVTRNEDNTFNYELFYLKTLIETLLEQYNESNTRGLVKDSTNENLYYYTGTNEEVSNNFLWYGGHQWRVLEFDMSANTLTLITQQPLTAIQPASEPWTTASSYESSYINTWLNNYFWNSLDSSIQAKILDSTFNVGIYTDVDEITIIKKVGLLDQAQYERAGNQNSFLDIKNYYWLGNRYNSSDVRSVDYDGILNNDDTKSRMLGVRAVIKISDLIVTEGDGTLTNSYRITNTLTNISDVQIGEYINVPYSGSDNACGNDDMCTFRVVSKDNDSIKVVLNGLLPNTSVLSTGEGYLEITDKIFTPLNLFLESISSNYKYTGEKSFYIGYYTDGSSYENVKNKIMEINVGLPVIGEMFSGNDIDLITDEKTFVDVSTIENPNVSNFYWLMNWKSPFTGRVVNEFGLISYAPLSNSEGVRPVIFLKNNLTFTGGEGTAQSPYTLE